MDNQRGYYCWKEFGNLITVDVSGRILTLIRRIQVQTGKTGRRRADDMEHRFWLGLNGGRHDYMCSRAPLHVTCLHRQNLSGRIDVA